MSEEKKEDTPKRKRNHNLTLLWNKHLKQAQPNPTFPETYQYRDLKIGMVQVNGVVVGCRSIGKGIMYHIDDGTAVLQVLFYHVSDQIGINDQRCYELSHWKNRLTEDDPRYLPDNKGLGEWANIYTPIQQSLLNKTLYKVKQVQKTLKEPFQFGECVKGFGYFFLFDDVPTISAVNMFRVTLDEETAGMKEKIDYYKSHPILNETWYDIYLRTVDK